MRTLTIGETSWPLTSWTPAKHAALIQFIRVRYLETKRPEEEAYDRVKSLPENLQTIAFQRYLDRHDTLLPTEEQSTRILLQAATVRYMAALVCPECPREAITDENAIESYCQLLPTPPNADEKAQLYTWMFNQVAMAARGNRG